MTRPTGAVGYRAVLRLPGAPRAFAAATLGRLSYGTLALSLLLAVQDATGSYLAAGTALGAFGVTSVLMPAKSRLIDRLGQRRVLPVLSAGFALAFVAMAVCSAAGVSRGPGYVALAVVAGLVAPPLGPSMRALWAALTPEPAARQRAYSLDGVVEETLFAVGPLLAGALVAVADAAAALAVTGLLNVVGATAMATSPAARRLAPPATAARTGTPLTGPFRSRRFTLLIVAVVAVGLGQAPLDLAVVARAESAGRPGAAGYVLAAIAVGGAVGGLAWGALTHRGRTSTQLGGLVALTALGYALAATTPTTLTLAVVLGLTGVVVAPVYVVSYLAADRLAPAGTGTEATTWVNTASNTGLSVGAALAGSVVDRSGATGALLTGAAVLALTAVALLTGGGLPAAPGSAASGQAGTSRRTGRSRRAGRSRR